MIAVPTADARDERIAELELRVASLEAGLAQLVVAPHLTLLPGGPPTSVLSPDEETLSARMDLIDQIVADAYRVAPAHLHSTLRDGRVSGPRQLAMFLAREQTGASYPWIARHYGKKDHTTAIYAVRAVTGRIERGELRLDVDRLRAQVRAALESARKAAAA